MHIRKDDQVEVITGDDKGTSKIARSPRCCASSPSGIRSSSRGSTGSTSTCGRARRTPRAAGSPRRCRSTSPTCCCSAPSATAASASATGSPMTARSSATASRAAPAWATSAHASRPTPPRPGPPPRSRPGVTGEPRFPAIEQRQPRIDPAVRSEAGPRSRTRTDPRTC